MTALDLSKYTLTFRDEFDTLSISQDGEGTTWRNIRPEWRFDANSDIGFGSSSFVDAASGYNPFSVKDGILTITAVPDRTEFGYPGSWESGLISTEGLFSQTYGYFEIRADFSDALGAWNAFWLLPDEQIPDPFNNGSWQELDIVENYGDWPQGVYSHIHTTDAWRHANWQRDLQVYSELENHEGFHTFGVDWNKDTLDFYVDQKFIWSQPTPTDMHGPMHILANLATQTSGPNNANIANVPMSMKIDYIRAYSHGADNSKPVIPEPAAPQPTAPDDTAEIPPAVSIGNGPDELILSISQDAYKGDAQYKVLVDGVQVGGVLTATASRAAGESELVTVKGNWGDGAEASVVFLNDAWGGTASTDRNLYVNGAVYNGVALEGTERMLETTGASHRFELSAEPNHGSSAKNLLISLGNGPDELILSISQDAYKGDAQYKIFVDGSQIGGVHSAKASRAAGESDTIKINGDWGDGPFDAAVVFINDVWGGTASADRNLYVDGATYNGIYIEDAERIMKNNGAHHFSIDEI